MACLSTLCCVDPKGGSNCAHGVQRAIEQVECTVAEKRFFNSSAVIELDVGECSLSLSMLGSLFVQRHE